MKTKKRQKLCPNCEGEVDLDVIVCPFCAADLRQEKLEEKRAPQESLCSAQHMSDSLYPSPKPRETEEPTQEKQEQSSLWMIGSMGLFILGAYLLFFGLIMILFSHQGFLVLKWTTRYWFLYLFASIPLLFFGYRNLFNCIK